MNILPQSTLRIVRQLSDPSDSDTYYVQAVVKNSATSAVLATVNLTDEGSQRFTGSYFTAPDASGNGYYIDVTTTVYTDSGYTTLSANYSRDTFTYHVFQEQMHFGGGGAEVNYDKIRKLIKEELAAQEKMEIPEQRDITPEMLAVERRIKDVVLMSVQGIKMPEQVQPDLDRVIRDVNSKVDEAINTILLAVDQKEVTPEPDFTPVLGEIQSLPIQAMFDALTALNEKLNTLQEIVNTQTDLDALKNAADEFMKKVSPRTLNVPKEKPVDMMQMRARKLLGV